MISKKGFTLVELLGVLSLLAIIGILSYPQITGLLKKASDNEYKRFIDDISFATEAYIQTNEENFEEIKEDEGVAFISFEDLVKSGFLKSTMYDPNTKQNVIDELNYTVKVMNNDSNLSYIIMNDDYTTKAYVQNGLVLHYDGYKKPISKDGQTIWKDLSGNSNDAILFNINNTSESGYQKDGVLLDGVDDDFNINLKNSIPANSSITIQLIFTNYDLTKLGLLSADSGWGYFMSHLWDNNGNLYIGPDCQTGHNTDSRFTPSDINYQIPVNTLIKLTYVYNGDTKNARLIISTIDGKKVDVNKTFVLEPKEITLFKANNGNLSNNKYSQILIYNRALTNDEIKQNYKIDEIRFGINNDI